MGQHTNHLGQPVGAPVEGWTPRAEPSRDPMVGRFCRLEALDLDEHAASLYEAQALDTDGRSWTYLPYGPFASAEDHDAWLERCRGSADEIFFAIIDTATERAVGTAAYLRIAPAAGSIEVGHLHFTPLLQRTPAATEAMYLMMRRAFEDLGYRRYEWKCDSLNAPSRRAAERLGFTFEGIHRQATVARGRNRHTAWFSILDSEWPERRTAFEAWLDPSNFDADGRQRATLEACRAAVATTTTST